MAYGETNGHVINNGRDPDMFGPNRLLDGTGQTPSETKANLNLQA